MTESGPDTKRLESKAVQVSALIRQECVCVQVEALTLLEEFLSSSSAPQSAETEPVLTVELARQMVHAYGEAKLPGPSQLAGGEAAATLLDAEKPAIGQPDFQEFLVVTESWPRRDRRTWWQRLFLPSLAERLRAWQALTASFSQANLASAPDLNEMVHQYDHLKAWQCGMAVKIGAFMTLFVVLGGIIVQYVGFSDAAAAAAGQASHTLGLAPYLETTYWGAVGACAAALYRLNQEATSRSLRLKDVQEYVIKPVLGGILGLLVTILAPALLNNQVNDVQPRTLSLMAMVAALCGMCEASFFRRVKSVTAALLGMEEKKEEAHAAA